MKVHFDNILAVWKYWNIMTEYWNVCSDFVRKSAFLAGWFYIVWNAYATVVQLFLPDRSIQENCGIFKCVQI